MHPLRLLSFSEQVAAHLRGELDRGHWTENLPGVDKLALELGVNRKTVESALQMLEKEGRLVGQGAGRQRRIVTLDGKAMRPMRIAFLCHDPLEQTDGYTVELLHLLLAEGHTVFFAEASMLELKMDLPRIARLVRKTKADAWVVSAGSREVLEWFCTQKVSAFALFGRREGIPIASVGPDKPPAYTAATRHLIGRGHRNIVLLARRERRLPEPGLSERAFLDELKAHGIKTGAYNLPDWEETVDGFHTCLHELFRFTPPTALIIDEAPFFLATLQFLMNRRLMVPAHVSLICSDGDPAFAWFKPSVARIHWDTGPVIRRVVRWAGKVSRGGKDICQTLTKAKFIPGGTIGPAVNSGK